MQKKVDVYFNQVLVLPQAGPGPGVSILLLNTDNFNSINIRQGHFVIMMDQEKKHDPSIIMFEHKRNMNVVQTMEVTKHLHVLADISLLIIVFPSLVFLSSR